METQKPGETDEQIGRLIAIINKGTLRARMQVSNEDADSAGWNERVEAIRQLQECTANLIVRNEAVKQLAISKLCYGCGSILLGLMLVFGYIVYMWIKAAHGH